MHVLLLERSRHKETKTVGKSPWQIDKRSVSVGQHKCGIYAERDWSTMRSIRQRMGYEILYRMAENIGEDRNTVEVWIIRY